MPLARNDTPNELEETEDTESNAVIVPLLSTETMVIGS
jgi:hypothetical protein